MPQSVTVSCSSSRSKGGARRHADVRMGWRLRACGVWLLCLLAGSPVQASPHMLIGQQSTDFALRSMEGGNMRLSEHIGEVVILHFWATWCGSCRQEIPLLGEIHDKYARVGLVTFGVNLDEDREAAAAMARALRIAYPVLIDGRKDVSKDYRVGTLPVTVLIDRAGIVRYISEGYRPGDEVRYTRKLRELLNE